MAVTDAVLAALTAGGVPAAAGGRPANTGTKPFVVIWPQAPVRTAATMRRYDRETTVLVCHCAGLTVESVGVAERKLAAAVTGLHGQLVDGRSVHAVEQVPARPMERDDDVDPPLYDLPVEWRIHTTPA